MASRAGRRSPSSRPSSAGVRGRSLARLSREVAWQWLKAVYLTAKLPLMAGKKTLFQKIMDREEPGDIVYEDDRCAALRDINPQAPTHLLIVPRKPIPDLDALTEEDASLVGHLFLVAQKIAAEEGLTDGYRTVFNNGSAARQTVRHIHLHLLGGRRMGWPPG